MWVLVVIATAAASYNPGIHPILQTKDEVTCLADRQRLIDTKTVSPGLVLCLPGSLN